MKKTKTFILGLVLLALIVLPISQGSAVDFIVTANVKPATGVTIVATENHMSGDDEIFGDEVTAFNFNTGTGFLEFDSENNIYVSDHFFAIDVAATGGAGSPNVTVSYGTESNPAGQATGLGVKATATFSKVTGGPDPEDQTDAIIGSVGTKLLSQISGGQFLSSTLLQGGFARIRVGIYDGGNAALNTAGGEPFTNGDLPGPYSGVITVTATP